MHITVTRNTLLISDNNPLKLPRTVYFLTFLLKKVYFGVLISKSNNFLFLISCIFEI